MNSQLASRKSDRLSAIAYGIEMASLAWVLTSLALTLLWLSFAPPSERTVIQSGLGLLLGVSSTGLVFFVSMLVDAAANNWAATAVAMAREERLARTRGPVVD